MKGSNFAGLITVGAGFILTIKGVVGKELTQTAKGENEFCQIRSYDFFSGYFTCVPSKQATRKYKEDYKTAKSSYNFLSFCLLMLEQRLNQVNNTNPIETKKYNQSDYPLWIWTTYNILCYHCKVYKNYEVAGTICSLLKDFISGFLSKVCCDMI